MSRQHILADVASRRSSGSDSPALGASFSATLPLLPGMSRKLSKETKTFTVESHGRAQFFL